MRPLHLAVVPAVPALMGCSDATASDSPAAEVVSPPAYDAAIVIPEAKEGRVAAGTIIEVIYPGGESRGITHYLQRWDGQTWSDVYVIGISFPDQPYDQQLIEKAWAPADEGLEVEAIGFGGSEGGQFTVIPPPTEPGTYRICGDQQNPLCSEAFEVTT